MRLSEILKGIKYKGCGRNLAEGLEIGRVTADSRAVGKGDMFVAFRGYAADGYGFIGQAAAKGAGAIVAEKDFDAPGNVAKVLVEDTRKVLPIIADNFYCHPSEKLKVIGVTGTNGKTTITYIIESILKRAGEEPGVIGTINYRLGGRTVPAKNTTPGPLELQSMLAEMVKDSSHYAVMEVSSHALDQHRVDSVLYDAAIFTNITPEHLDYHKTPEEYFNAKAKIFRLLKKGGVAVLNNDDPKVRALKGAIGGKCVTYGLKEKADMTAKNMRLSIDDSKFDIIPPRGGKFSVKARLIGRHNVSNILAAAAACEALGIRREHIKEGIEAMAFVPGRLEGVECGQPFKVFVDFAHTEDALYNVLGLLREVSKARIITVFGCGGNRDKGKRPLMGRAACKLSDHVIITSDNPRFEDAGAIIDGIVGGVRGEFHNYEIEPDRRKAIEKALSLAEVGSIVVMAGKGHEGYQIVGDKTLPFDDKEMVKAALRDAKRGSRHCEEPAV